MKKLVRYSRSISVIMMLLVPCFGYAATPEIKWSGFATLGTSFTNSETTYIDQVDRDGSYLDTRLGHNLSTRLSSKLTLGAQILTAGRENEFDAHADWVFARYTATNNISLLFGKMKYPNLLFSEFYDVGNVYPWARAPQEVYNLEGGGANALYEAMQGGSVISTFEPADDVELSFQAYFGSADSGLGEINKMFGLVANLQTESMQFKLGFNRGTLIPGAGGHGAEEEEEEEEEGAEAFPDWDGATPEKNVLSASMMIEEGNLLVLAEYTNTQFDGFDDYEIAAGYATIGYSVDKLMPSITVAKLKREDGLEQVSTTVGLRYAMSSMVSVKFDVSRIVVEPATELADDHDPAGLFFGGTPEKDVLMGTFTLGVAF